MPEKFILLLPRNLRSCGSAIEDVAEVGVQVSNQNLLKQLNHVLDLFVEYRKDKADTLASWVSAEDTPSANRSKLVQALEFGLDKLMDLIAGLKGTISRDFVRQELLSRFIKARAAGVKFSELDADEFKQALLGLPIQKLRVVRRLYGVDASPDNTPVQIGPFVIDFGAAIFGPFKEHPLVSLTWRPEDAKLLYIQCSVDARDGQFAIALADQLFDRFELIFRVFIGMSPMRLEVGVLHYVGPKMRGQMVISAAGPLRQGSSWEGALQPFILNDPRFPMPVGAFARLFSLISKDATDFEKHILRCAEWTGQAIADSNPASALVKAAIALEVLFSGQEKGMITPSITAQIAEGSAFLLGTGRDSRIHLEREVKRLYGIRSAVVHSGKDSVNQEDLFSFIRICRSIVVLLLSEGEFFHLTSMTELATHLKNKKYS
jgi:Apea-like HEPN